MESDKKPLILHYLSREHEIRLGAIARMNEAEDAFKLEANQVVHSNAVIDDLLVDLMDVEYVEPPVSMGD